MGGASGAGKVAGESIRRLLGGERSGGENRDVPRKTVARLQTTEIKDRAKRMFPGL